MITPLITKIVGGAALVVIATFATLWQLSERRADRLYDQIHAEDTGYAARLTTCRSNVNGLESSLKTQNEAVEALETESERRMAEIREEIEAADSRASQARQQAEALRNRPIQGVTVCERLLDVDAAFLEILQ